MAVSVRYDISLKSSEVSKSDMPCWILLQIRPIVYLENQTDSRCVCG